MIEHLLAAGLLFTIVAVAVHSAAFGVGPKIVTFLLLFYSVAPLFEFSNFRYFQASIDYSWRADVFLIYIAVLLTLFLPLLVIEKYQLTLNTQRFAFGYKVLWLMAVVGLLNDIYLNHEYMFLPKADYIYAMPHISNNFVFFHFPAIEVLAGALVFSPFRSKKLYYAVVVAGVAAVALSLVIGVRHVVLLLALAFLLPRLGVFGMLVAVAVATFFGELTNVLKVLVDLLVGRITSEDMLFLLEMTERSILRVSGEQMAVLSNLLIKLDHPDLFDFTNWLLGSVRFIPFFSGIISAFGVAPEPSPASLIYYVGAGRGQGTAYSIHLVFIESLGLIFIYYLVCLILCLANTRSILIVLAGEVFYSIMRNGSEFWLYLAGRLMFFMLLAMFISFLFSAHKQRQRPQARITHSSARP